MFNQATAIEFSLPDWVNAYVGQRVVLMTPEDRMQLVVGAARENVNKATGGPFAAAVFESHSGKLVSLGVNLVTAQKLSMLHAEIVAISLAQRKLGVYDLGGAGLPQHELVTSAEPCAMCFGAIPWSGISQLTIAARDADTRAIGFDEGPKPLEWKKELEQRGISVFTDVQRKEATHVLNQYLTQGGHLYNSREGD